MTGVADAETGSCGGGVAAGFGIGERGIDEGVGHVDGRGWVCWSCWWIVGLWVAGGFLGGHFGFGWAFLCEILEVMSRVRMGERGEERKRAISNHYVWITKMRHGKQPANKMKKGKPAV